MKEESQGISTMSGNLLLSTILAFNYSAVVSAGRSPSTRALLV